MSKHGVATRSGGCAAGIGDCPWCRRRRIRRLPFVNGAVPEHGPAAVLIAAHYEEPVIAATLESALMSYAPDDVFVFDDASADATVEIARAYLPSSNVIEHTENVGKSRGLEIALAEHVYPRGYQYVTIVDADTTLEPQYRERALDALRDDHVVCAAGQVKSRPYGKNVISLYRACLYFLWQAIFKRLQSATNAIAIAPGCASTWKTTALRSVHFNHQMSTEDFHLSVAAHRLGLGRIRYVPDAVVWTQDPLTFRAFTRQAMRWSRAWWEAVRYHRLGLMWLRRGLDGRLRPSSLDICTALIVVTMELFFLRLLGLAFFLAAPIEPPPILLLPASDADLMVDLGAQLGVMTLAIVIAAVGARRPLAIAFAPVLVGLMVIEFLISTAMLVGVLRHQYRPSRAAGARGQSSTWTSPERRRVPEFTQMGATPSVIKTADAR